MILSKNGKSFILISHKKSFTKIVTAPHTKFERDFFRCSETDEEVLCIIAAYFKECYECLSLKCSVR